MKRVRKHFAESPLVFALLICLGLGVSAGLACAEADPAAGTVRQAIRDHIDAAGGRVSLDDPTSGGPVDLTFEALHEGVEATAGGRHVACVDFRSSDGKLYDVDFYVGTAGGSGELSVGDMVVHKIEGRDVLAAERRAELDQRS